VSQKQDDHVLKLCYSFEKNLDGYVIKYKKDDKLTYGYIEKTNPLILLPLVERTDDCIPVVCKPNLSKILRIFKIRPIFIDKNAMFLRTSANVKIL
jgi:hypothetical protein